MRFAEWKQVALASVVAVSLAGCGREGPATNERIGDEGVAGTTGIREGAEAGFGVADDDVDTFLDGYVREDERFADDTLNYEVNNGIVTATGQVDSQEELTALQSRIRRVPGVRDLNASGVRVGEG